ncbi:MAG: metalloregulator ArsR/SmtB family transcription factor [Gemmatimonadaceae bacterium]|nr:metalloregulator ArsR/SmtB family transcription factor [Gemmatimonadaceae bacterium]
MTPAIRTPAKPAPLPATATLFSALADPTRLRILALLRDGETCVCDLQRPLGIAQPLLSFHLRALRDAGLVTTRREGRWAYYAIAPDALTAAHDAVTDLLRPRTRGRSLPNLPSCC